MMARRELLIKTPCKTMRRNNARRLFFCNTEKRDAKEESATRDNATRQNQQQAVIVQSGNEFVSQKLPCTKVLKNAKLTSLLSIFEGGICFSVTWRVGFCAATHFSQPIITSGRFLCKAFLLFHSFYHFSCFCDKEQRPFFSDSRGGLVVCSLDVVDSSKELRCIRFQWFLIPINKSRFDPIWSVNTSRFVVVCRMPVSMIHEAIDFYIKRD